MPTGVLERRTLKRVERARFSPRAGIGQRAFRSD